MADMPTTEQSMARKLVAAGHGALRLLARPVGEAEGDAGVVVQAYRGYGSAREIFLIGRVFSQPGSTRGTPATTVPQAMGDIGRRLLRRGVADAVLHTRFCGREDSVTTDQDGYFRVHSQLVTPPPADRLWHPMAIELVKPVRVQIEAEIFIPSASCRFVVISDIDDTVMETGVASKAKMLWRLFMEGAESRLAFPGVAATKASSPTHRTGADQLGQRWGKRSRG